MERKVSLLIGLLFLTVAWPAYPRSHPSTDWIGQQLIISGKVIDSAGTALPGVTISFKEKPSIATSTDLNGRYQLEIPSQGIVVFNLIGYESQEIVVDTGGEVNVTLLPSSQQLDDVVVVGFGKQKRTDMIGSVVSVKPADLKVPSSNLTTALAGRIAGMIAYQRSGEPGMDNADFFIRGVTTFGYKVDPLILIDNIEVTTTDLARMQVDDIASFSIMKDATATAIYGARGANGVILITTKEGVEGKAKLSLRYESSLSEPTRNLELADPITYMKLHNESIQTRDPQEGIFYERDKIDQTIAGNDPIRFPATDWRSTLIKDQTINQRFNLSVNGGGKLAKYYVSGAFNQDNGALKVNGKNNFNNNIDLKTYSLRTNVNMNLTETTELMVKLTGSFDDYRGPINGGTKVFRDIMRTNPVLFAPYYEPDPDHMFVKHIMFGNYESGNYLNPYADMVKGYKDYSRSMMMAQAELRQQLSFVTEGLSFRVMANTTRNSYFDVLRAYQPFFYSLTNSLSPGNGYALSPLNENIGTDYLDYKEGDKTVSSIFYLESAINYSRTFNDKHTFSGLLVGILRQALNSNAGDLQQSLPYRNTGVSGRFTYAFDNRYFTEFNFGYNGSERFYKDQRFGFFPSAGVAWSISNERFFEPIKHIVSNLRIRGTYGKVGNDAIGGAADRFFYLSNLNMNNPDRGVGFGTDHTYTRNGISIDRYPNTAITWETATKKNLALEIGLFNKANIIAEYFSEYRRNILMTRASIPKSMGLNSEVRANVGEATGNGLDVSVDYSESLSSGMWIQARGNFTYATSEYRVFEEPHYADPYLSRVGYPLSQQWGYIAERLFIDESEVGSSPKQNFGEYMAGDIKYRDINDDGQITTLDRVPLGYPTTPEIVYGFGFSAGFKNIDLSAFFQGVARESFWIDAAATAPFVAYEYDGESFPANTILQNQLLAAYANDHWSEDNSYPYALWPRLSYTPIQNNEQTSTWFMRNGAFLRLKQVELGYSLLGNALKQLHIDKLRVYVNATNLFTWSKFKLWDVEMAGNGLGYPIQRVFNMGVQISL